ncbi:MAG: ATP-binding protein [Kofleriaceae bacterium]
MATVNDDRQDPTERSSTDESLRFEREKTDSELASRSLATRDAALEVVAQARQETDTVLSAARDREDQAAAGATTDEVHDERAREDSALRSARHGADTTARREREQRRVALARLLAFEREDTDLRLEIERKRADQALTSREDFMAMVSHDLRSLLGGIALSAELLKGVESADNPFERVTRYAESIQRFSARMTRLVGDLMDVASIEAGRLALVRSERSVGDLLRDSMEAFGPGASAQGIDLTCESDHDLGTAALDHERILQVLTNLVGNALKFTPRGGRIKIRADRDLDKVRFTVADTGDGIAPELLEKVFERYFQSIDGDRRGLGLGLYIAKSIITGHQGTIWATSEGKGQGSTIHFTIPVRS